MHSDQQESWTQATPAEFLTAGVVIAPYVFMLAVVVRRVAHLIGVENFHVITAVGSVVGISILFALPQREVCHPRRIVIVLTAILYVVGGLAYWLGP